MRSQKAPAGSITQMAVAAQLPTVAPELKDHWIPPEISQAAAAAAAAAPSAWLTVTTQHLPGGGTYNLNTLPLHAILTC